jgi:hypothetical protein
LVLRVSLPSLYFKIVKAWDLFQKKKRRSNSCVRPEILELARTIVG